MVNQFMQVLLGKFKQILMLFFTECDRVKEAGYTPMYYSYKPYTLAHVDYKRIIKEFPESLWIAE